MGVVFFSFNSKKALMGFSVAHLRFKCKEWIFAQKLGNVLLLKKKIGGNVPLRELLAPLRAEKLGF